MKRLTVFTLFVVLLTAFGFDTAVEKQEERAADEFFQSYVKDFLLFQEEVNRLAGLAKEMQQKIDLPALRQQHAETRFAFKRVEFYFDYRHSHYNHLYINGGPLPKFDGEDTGQPIEPRGLQTLEELIYSEEAAEQLPLIIKRAGELKRSVDYIGRSHLNNRVTDQYLIDALRSGIVRVFTLGLTGFDTPASDNAMEEVVISMRAMEKAFLFFEEHLNPAARKTFGEIKALYREAKQLLASNSDFDTFDRMAFLKQITNPLFGKLRDFQLQNEISTEPFHDHALNFESRNLFEEHFLRTAYYSQFSFIPLDNPASIALGKMLFYDPILSKDNKMSCASCHDPRQAFTDGLPKSKGNAPGKFTRRNSPTLIDAGYSSRYFWDMREYNLERQVAHVINDTLEFNSKFSDIARRLAQSPAYVRMFESLYGGIAKQPIYRRSISNAIAAYVNSLTSFDSEFDRFVRNEITDYPQEAVRGFNLFMGKAACGTCHFAPVFNGVVPPFYTETESEVLGITLGLDTLNPQMDPDPGRIANGLKRDDYPYLKNSFKTVSVRNIALTAPYMHNGLFTTLEEVLEFYDRGGGAGMGLDIDNQTLPDTPLNLSQDEKADITAFLHTLTDTTGLTNARVELPEFAAHPEWNDRGR